MPIFGQCPAQDDFYLVMCSHCGQVVKPQAFQAHYGGLRGLGSGGCVLGSPPLFLQQHALFLQLTC
ncbi:hypothetical protein PAMP_017788 [Pampus punctatissimus]